MEPMLPFIVREGYRGCTTRVDRFENGDEISGVCWRKMGADIVTDVERIGIEMVVELQRKQAV